VPTPPKARAVAVPARLDELPEDEP
jgi:hypothetical protein